MIGGIVMGLIALAVIGWMVWLNHRRVVSRENRRWLPKNYGHGTNPPNYGCSGGGSSQS